MNKSLGRGLSSLISSNPPGGSGQRPIPPAQGKLNYSDEADMVPSSLLQTKNQEIYQVPPAEVHANPHQPRRHFDEAELENLKLSIQEHGILQPLVVTHSSGGGYELVAGERRLRAAQLLNLKTVPVIVRSLGELEKLELAIVENIQRQDLNPIERAVAYKKLIDEFSLTHEQAAKRMGKSRPVISNHLRLLELPEEVKDLVSTGRLSETLALMVLEINDPAEQVAFAMHAAEQKMTKREAQQIIRKNESPTGANKARGTRDPLMKSLEDDLQRVLGTRVKIGRRGKKGWVIEVEAYSQEELEAIVKKIGDNF